ncbi:MAG: general stress protein [Alphaproteobacteria bacterium]
MKAVDSAIAVFADHEAAENAVKQLAQSGFNIRSLSIVGKGYHSEEQVAGFYNQGDRVKLWGLRGAFWGGLWGLFFGGLFLTVPLIGHVIALGYFATLAISTIETAALTGGASAIVAALSGLGIPKDSIIRYETAIKADKFLVMAHGSAHDATRAQAILDPARSGAVERYSGMGVPVPDAE